MRGNSHRASRVNSDIEFALSKIIREEVKDPRVGLMTSVTMVNATPDLKECKVYISVLGDDTQKKETMTVLKNASGFIRHKLAESLNLRTTPELRFIYDDSIEYGVNMSKKIEEIVGSMESEDEDGQE